jgi:hypothetical protein
LLDEPALLDGVAQQVPVAAILAALVRSAGAVARAAAAIASPAIVPCAAVGAALAPVHPRPLLHHCPGDTVVLRGPPA